MTIHDNYLLLNMLYFIKKYLILEYFGTIKDKVVDKISVIIIKTK